MKFEDELKERIAYCEEAIRQYLPKEDKEGYLSNVIGAMNYSLLAGGKRLRPTLMLETWRMFGGEREELLRPFLAAIEMIHTYSLVHDDLPAMDNDQYRRGRKTTHAVYGEAMGILAGDGLLNYAYETAMKVFPLIDALPETAPGKERYRKQALQALGVLAAKPGVYGMLGGQAVDVESEGSKLSLSKLAFIHRLKTAALVEASMMIGAYLAGAETSMVQKVEKAAENIGMAFQIRDDILDVTGTQDELGKPIHSDERNEKCTYVACVGLEKANQDVEEFTLRSISLLKETQREAPFLTELFQWLVHRKY